MPTITTYYGIPGPVPFVDVEVSADNRLYVDPHAIRLQGHGEPFADHALRCLDTFTAQVTDSILAGTPASLRHGEQLLQRFVEPWETRLGMSRRGFHGHGGADVVGTGIWDILTGDVEALVRIGVLKQIEDLPLFVDGIDCDITSDITTRIVFEALAHFTAQMLARYPQFSEGGHQVSAFTRQVWSSEERAWVEAEITLPVADGKALMLVPAGWVRHTLLMSAGRYYGTSVLSYAQLEQAVRGADGKLNKTPKDRLKKQSGLERGRSTNLAVTMRAFESGDDLLAAFKVFVLGRLEKKKSEEKAA
ncbi:hypothetical protein [Rarobacter incanus]|uniref:Uncharacterized protein n=1 Tax=Rarobacter incanus TaxID=153494 RepID=A0A542SP13_9MICO|nr:hypothetical protein [Rarobacter incanus]TQK76298.1 hypothetical protein FB389_0961 [Rarobacter incanus]